MILPTMLPGPFALDIHSSHEWAKYVALYGRAGHLWLRWEGGHEHVCQVIGHPVVDGDRVLVTTEDHGQLVLRPIAPTDTWMVHGDAGSMTAWEASRRGLL